MTSPPTTPNGPARAAFEIDPVEALTVLVRSWRRTVLLPLGVGVLTLIITFLIPPTFTASTTIVPPAQQSSSALSAIAGQLGALGGLAGAAGMGAGLKNPADQYVAFLKSRNVSDRIIERFSLKELYEKELLHDARLQLGKRVRIEPGKKDGFIVISVDDHDPKRAAEMANAFVDELRRLNSELAVGEASQRRLFFEEQLKVAREGLSKAEEELNEVGVSPSALNTAPQAAVAAVAKLKAAITAQEVKIASLRGFVTDDNPELRQAYLELSALRGQLSAAGEGSPESDGRPKYTEKFRAFKYQETLFELMAKQYELARLDEAREGNLIQVLDVATVPERKSKPKKAEISVLATLFAALLASGFTVAEQLWWRRRKP